MESLLKETDYFTLYAIGNGVYAAIAKPAKVHGAMPASSI